MFDGDYGVASKITLCVTISSLIPIIFSVSFFESLPRSDDTNSKRTFGGTTGSPDTTKTQNWYIDTGIALILSIALLASLASTIRTEWITSQLVPLMVTVTAGGIVGTTSSILYYPHAATATIVDVMDAESSTTSSNIAKRQTTAMLFGTASSNLLVAILAMLQQEKLERQFSDHLGTSTVRNYFAVLMFLIALSVIGFVGTLLIRRVLNHNAASKISKLDADDHTMTNEQSSLLESQPMEDVTEEVIVVDPQKSKKMKHTFSSFWRMTYLNSTLNAAQFILNALTFFLPGIVPYSVRNEHDDEDNQSSNALQYLIVFQLVAHTLGVLASSRGGITSGETTTKIIQCQLGSFFLFLWIPMVFFSLSKEKRFGVTIPIVWNTLLNFTYAYCNTSWFHVSVHHHHHQEQQYSHSIGDSTNDTFISVSEEESSDSLYSSNNTDEAVSTTSAVRIMGTWHQIGATFGSVVAFAMIQSAAILSN